MLALLALIAIELALVLYALYRIYQLLEAQFSNYVTTIDGNITGISGDVSDLRDHFVPTEHEV